MGSNKKTLDNSSCLLWFSLVLSGLVILGWIALDSEKDRDVAGVENTVSVSRGQAAVLEPPQSLTPHKHTVTWQTGDGTPLFGRMNTVVAHHHLVILSVSDSDQKAYRATAARAGQAKEEDSAYYRLVVEGEDEGEEIAPEMIFSPQDVIVVKEAPLTELHCVVNARPLHELETVWLKDDLPLERAGVSYLLQDPWNRTLSLVYAVSAHAGTYTCVAHLRGRDFPPVSAHARVTVRERTKVQGERNNHTEDLIGGGYSSDTQQLVSQKCFKASVASITEPHSIVRLDQAQSFSDFENSLGVYVSASGGFGMFSASAEASYLRSVQDQGYSLSLNYFSKYTNTLKVQLEGSSEVLTEFGRYQYNNSHEYFGLVCGDQYITSYEQGALLTMGMNIIFNSSQVKEEFAAKVGFSFGNIFSASAEVRRVVASYNMVGSVIIQAFQMGGKPEELSSIFSKNKTGQYYALTCSLTEIEDCINAASGLLDYATTTFRNQLSFVDNKGLTPLGIGAIQFNPIKYLGLKEPDSLVTPEVQQLRMHLASKFKESQYYEDKLHPFFSQGYPVDLEKDFLGNASSLLTKAKDNVRVLQRAHEGASDCFHTPDKCENITANLELHSITDADLSFLETIKYVCKIQYVKFYSTGTDLVWWYAGLTTWFSSEKSYEVFSFTNITDTDHQLSFNFKVSETSGYEWRYDGYSTDGGWNYEGDMKYRNNPSNPWSIVWGSYRMAKEISPFFFQAYNA